MKQTGFIGVFELFGVTRHVRYEDGEISIKHASFEEMLRMIKLLERANSSGVRQEHPRYPTAQPASVESLSRESTEQVTEQVTEQATPVADQVVEAPAAEEKPKRRGRKPRASKVESPLEPVEPDEQPEEEPEEPPKIERRKTEAPKAKAKAKPEDSVPPPAATEEIPAQIKNAKNVRDVVEFLNNKKMPPAEIKAWMQANQASVPVLDRLGTRINERIDRLFKLLPGFA